MVYGSLHRSDVQVEAHLNPWLITLPGVDLVVQIM